MDRPRKKPKPKKETTKSIYMKIQKSKYQGLNFDRIEKQHKLNVYSRKLALLERKQYMSLLVKTRKKYAQMGRKKTDLQGFEEIVYRYVRLGKFCDVCSTLSREVTTRS